MAKTKTGKVAPTVETLKPYLDRALGDPEFREDLKEAIGAARKLYGPLVKENGGISHSASKLATDAKVQENLRKALEEFDVTVTFCFTPEDAGIELHYTSPPRHPEEYAEFCAAMVRRYAC